MYKVGDLVKFTAPKSSKTSLTFLILHGVKILEEEGEGYLVYVLDTEQTRAFTLLPGDIQYCCLLKRLSQEEMLTHEVEKVRLAAVDYKD